MTIDDILKSAELVLDDTVPYPYFVFAGGTGCPDQDVIDHYSDTSIIVIARDGSKWQYGKKIE